MIVGGKDVVPSGATGSVVARTVAARGTAFMGGGRRRVAGKHYESGQDADDGE